MTAVRVGLFPSFAQRAGELSPPALLARAAAEGIDHLCVGDHVSFFVGAGSDGLIAATRLLATQIELPVYVGVYLLPLRHPVLVARQLATIAAFAPGRLTLGIGIGGEDRHEVEVCGVDPTTRGRRADECLQILRGLAGGSPLTFQGEFFSLQDAQILPAPSAPVPFIIGGRSGAAVSRAARFGDGWLGIWVSPRRYAAVRDQIARDATQIGRDTRDFKHALNVWCGFAETREAARGLVATQMQAFYQSPFEQFERYSPYGTSEDVAEFLAPYIEAGCSTFNVIPCAADEESAIGAVAHVRSLLTTTNQPAIAGACHDRTPSRHHRRRP
jgi:alkanesulfonate monooxygenase SsuD/methylene tetrahydromethanopterin reductase-like flavin-dependent oxidoreductase (luciferase family)